MTHWKPCIKPMWIHVILSILRLKEEIGYSLLHFQKLVKCQVTSKATKRRKVEKKWEGRRVQREKEQAEGDKQNVTQELAALRAPASTDTCLLEDQAEAGRSAPPRGMVSHLLLSGPTWASAPLLLSDPGVSPGPDNGPDSGLALVLTSLLIDLGEVLVLLGCRWVRGSREALAPESFCLRRPQPRTRVPPRVRWPALQLQIRNLPARGGSGRAAANAELRWPRNHLELRRRDGASSWVPRTPRRAEQPGVVSRSRESACCERKPSLPSLALWQYRFQFLDPPAAISSLEQPRVSPGPFSEYLEKNPARGHLWVFFHEFEKD